MYIVCLTRLPCPGAPPPGYNITTLALSDALDDAQVRLVNATDQIAVLQAMQLQVPAVRAAVE